ncbi:MAG: sensor histidine kinase [Gammaproteobacteria bacterium]
MNAYRPASVLHILLISFSLVALPLIFALISATISVGRLSLQGRQAVFEAARIVESGRILTEEVTAMERNARQFQLLGDRSLYEGYLKRRSQFRALVDNLSSLDLSASQRKLLAELIKEETQIYQALRYPQGYPETVPQALTRFAEASELANSLLNESRASVVDGADRMGQAAAQVQHSLILQASALIPTVLLLALLGSLFIAKSVEQIERAIRQLGKGEFSSSIRVKGPKDLEEVGKHLDWLRLRLLELDYQKSKFLRHVSHDLKTPLTALREGSQLLRDEVVGWLNTDQAEIAEILHKNCLQLQDRIENLLRFSRVAGNNATKLAPQPVSLHQLVHQTLEEHKLTLQAKELSVEMELEPLQVNGDAEKLGVVLDNLFSNAIKYSPFHGKISVTLRNHENRIDLEVLDEGPGVDPAERRQVFEPFFQGRAIESGHVKGTGLGLAISQEYVKAHCGTIEVVEKQGGACFRVTLPRVVVA